MLVLSKIVEVIVDVVLIMVIVVDIECYLEWNEGVKGVWVFVCYDDGCFSQVWFDIVV